MRSTKSNYLYNTPKLGTGIFFPKDVSIILNLPYQKVRHWIFEFWDNRFAEFGNYSFGDSKNKAIDFYTLIEFYVFYQLRSIGISAQKIQKMHKELREDLKTKYPFAHSKISTDGKNVYHEKLNNLIKIDGKKQYSFREILEPFLTKIEYGENNIAERFYPLSNSKNVVVDPRHQFGQPTISGTNIKTQTIYNLYKAGESSESISSLYNLNPSKIKDAILWHKKEAA